ETATALCKATGEGAPLQDELGAHDAEISARLTADSQAGAAGQQTVHDPESHPAHSGEIRESHIAATGEGRGILLQSRRAVGDHAVEDREVLTVRENRPADQTQARMFWEAPAPGERQVLEGDVDG